MRCIRLLLAVASVLIAIPAVSAVGQVGLAVADPGIAPGVTTVTVDPSRGGASAISCPTTTWCMLVDGSGDSLVDDNGVWQAPVAIGSPVSHLSCASPSFCAATSAGDAFVFDGTSWKDYAGAMPDSESGAISCVSSTFCLATASSRATVFDGSTWSAPVQFQPTDAGGSDAVSCVSSSFCVAVDSWGNAAEYDGTSWTQSSNVTGDQGGQVDISCHSTSFCTVVQDQRAVGFDGTTWGPVQDLSGTPGYPTSISCPADGVCTAVDNTGAVLDLTGGTWTRTAGVDSNGRFQSISCSSVSRCVAIDSFGWAFVRSATTWSTGTVVDQDAGGLQQISCVSIAFCVAIDSAGNALTFDGVRWSAPTTIAPHTGFNALSCAAATFCVAVGQRWNSDGSTTGAIASYDGTGWQVVATNMAMNSVSCSSSSFCLAFGFDGTYTTYTNGIWSDDPQQGPDSVGDYVDCVSATFCATPNALFDGTSWRYASGSPAPSWSSISCASATYCVAPYGMFLSVFDGTSWQLTGDADGLSTGDPIDCRSSSFCIGLVPTLPDVVAYENGSASPYTQLAPADELDGFADLSCPSTERCFAVRGADVISWNTHISPVITQQPVGGTAGFNNPVELTAAGTGNPAPAVVWQTRSDTGVFYDYAVGSTLWANWGGDYRAVLRNSAGEVASRVVHVVIGVATRVTRQPQSHGCLKGTSTTFTATASGNPTPERQWQSSADGGRTWSILRGTRSATLTVGCARAARYRALFSNGSDRVYTHAALLSVWTAPTVVTQPVDRSGAIRNRVTFSARATGSPAPTVSWQSSGDGRHWTKIAGASRGRLSVVVTAARAGHRYRAVFTNRVGSVATRAARLTIRR